MRARVCKHLKEEVLLIDVTDFLWSLFNVLYMELELIWNISQFKKKKIQITCILSSPRAFIMALF